ncbi:trypsin-like serine protease [uncultured Chloroflexus sp.]|uniref:trypsin-like serine protease n=1 Tax=uncultured Chloroflexus sp. TaxID=214040 RepID=UPI002630B25E|nr:trypsin-like serine protease [uncultured Chloroflexus sp.]
MRLRYRIALLALVLFIGWLPVRVASRESTPPQLTIVGGTPVEPGEYPWLVALLIAEITDEAAAFCGGALIDDGGAFTTTQWVLTASHCLVDSDGNIADPASIQVLVGQQDLSQATAAQRYDVAEVIVHPFYVQDSVLYNLYNDVALLHLANPVNGISPIRIATPADAVRFAPGETAYIAGWGNRLPQTGFDFPDVAHKAQVPIVDLATCNERYDDALSSMHLCAGQYPAGGVDTCQGDSGGPLMVSDGSGGFLHAGIVSFGIGCSWPHFPGVYARTAFFADWITAQISGAAHVDIWQLPLSDDPEMPLHISTAAPNTPFKYLVQVANSGRLPLTSVVATVTVPTGATLVSGSISDDGVYNSSTNTVTWSLGALDAGEVRGLTYEVQAVASVTAGAVNVVAGSTSGPVTSSGRDPVTTVINQPRLFVAAFAPMFVEVGSDYSMLFTIINFGQGPAAGVSNLNFVVDLPTGVTPVAISDGGTQTGSQVIWPVAEISGGDNIYEALSFASGNIGDVLRITNYGAYLGTTPQRYGTGVQVITVPAVRYLPIISR